jgi:lysozyme family protein
MDANFEQALAHAMIYEVGAFFDPTDPETQAGLISTKAQRRKVGYVNDPEDRGGETKYGVAANANPGVDIARLTWAEALEIYYKKYWLAGGCHLLPARVASMHLDGCINHGVIRASKFLQQIVGVPQDGIVGPGTARAVAEMDELDVCNRLAARREEFYHAIVINKPSQARFLNGWMNRIEGVREYAMRADYPDTQFASNEGSSDQHLG